VVKGILAALGIVKGPIIKLGIYSRDCRSYTSPVRHPKASPTLASTFLLPLTLQEDPPAGARIRDPFSRLPLPRTEASQETMATVRRFLPIIGIGNDKSQDHQLKSSDKVIPTKHVSAHQLPARPRIPRSGRFHPQPTSLHSSSPPFPHHRHKLILRAP